MNDQNPRQIAARILSQRLTSGEFTENLLETALTTTRLSPVDRSLCHELVCGVVRWQATLDRLIARKTDPSRKLRPALRNLLRLGLYQIFWLDRIPPHAAVHETVELAKQAGYLSQSGLINAILRGYLRETEEIKKILADMKVSQPALGWSHPEWLTDKWRKQFNEEHLRQLLQWNNTPPKTFARINTLRTDASRLIERWRSEGVEHETFECDWVESNLVFELKSHPPLSKLGSLRDGWFYLQDPSTLLAPAVLAPQPGELILDACAAPGGKTTFMAQLMRNEGKIVAADADPGRLKLVRENCTRLGATMVQMPLPALISSPPQMFYDRILIDAPCSNTGVMRRRVDLRWRVSMEEMERLQKTQLELLSLAVAQLKPGGVVVYSTCSLEPEENSIVLKQFLAANPKLALVHERQLLPFVEGVDGAYVAKLVCSDSQSASP